MENNEMINVTEVAEVAGKTMGASCATKKIGVGEGAILGFAGIGVISTCYFGYKGIKWIIGKVKAKKAEKPASETDGPCEEPKAEEPTAE